MDRELKNHTDKSDETKSIRRVKLEKKRNKRMRVEKELGNRKNNRESERAGMAGIGKVSCEWNC